MPGSRKLCPVPAAGTPTCDDRWGVGGGASSQVGFGWEVHGWGLLVLTGHELFLKDSELGSR